MPDADANLQVRALRRGERFDPRGGIPRVRIRLSQVPIRRGTRASPCRRRLYAVVVRYLNNVELRAGPLEYPNANKLR